MGRLQEGNPTVYSTKEFSRRKMGKEKQGLPLPKNKCSPSTLFSYVLWATQPLKAASHTFQSCFLVRASYDLHNEAQLGFFD